MSKIAECFLTGITSENALIHQIGVFDPVTSSLETIHISDYAYQLVCESDDNVVAEMWTGWKQSYSSGYTDAGFIYQLQTDAKQFNMDLWVYRNGSDHYLTLEAPFSLTSQHTLVCTTVKPIYKRTLEQAALRALKVVEVKANFEDDRWGFFDQKTIVSLPWTKGLMNLCRIKFGDPPDLFRILAENQTPSGFELIRRVAL